MNRHFYDLVKGWGKLLPQFGYYDYYGHWTFPGPWGMVHKMREELFDRSACRVFQPWPLRVQFFEPGERGVEVCFIENLAAADQVAFVAP